MNPLLLFANFSFCFLLSSFLKGGIPKRRQPFHFPLLLLQFSYYVQSTIKMKVLSSLLLSIAIGVSSAFVVVPETRISVRSSSAVQMGLLDFFSDEARQKREEKKRREIEEQEKLQKAIMERRKNPEKMEEYERKVILRRQLRMAGDDEAASKVVIYEDVDKNTLLDGTAGNA